jgi:hypothetical protein
MKSFQLKMLSLATAALLGSEMADAQKVELGVRFMPTITSFQMQGSGGGTVKGQATFGYGVGGFVGVFFTDHIGVQGEVIYNSISQKYTDQSIQRQVKLQYVNIPVLLSLNTGKSKKVNLNVVFGPQMGLSVGSHVESTSGNGSVSSTGVLVVKKGDLGVAYGAGLDFGLGSMLRLGIGFRGVYGLIDISDKSKTIETSSYYLLDKTHVKTYSAYIGLSILL